MQKLWNDFVDTFVRAGQFAKDDDGEPLCGLRDVCDNLKNVIFVGGLIGVGVTRIIAPDEKLYASVTVNPKFLAVATIIPLVFLFLGLMRQGYFILCQLPGCRPKDDLAMRPVIILSAGTFYLSIVFGLLGIGLMWLFQFSDHK